MKVSLAASSMSSMPNADLSRRFSPEQQADYEAWLIERLGDPVKEDITRLQKAVAKISEAERRAVMEQLREIETALAEGMNRGLDPAADPIDRVISRHRAWVTSSRSKPCPFQEQSARADLYHSHPDFVKCCDTIAPGFTDFLVAATKAHAAKG